MKISILSWEYENIRRMGKLKIDLEESGGKVYGNTLIMMPNGTGKTTTLRLIGAALTGKAVDWKEDDVRSYRPSYQFVEKGKFCLKVSFDGDIFYYILNFDYELGEVKYETCMVNRSGGIESGHFLPHSLKDVFTEEFVNRFVFDGEQAQKTLNSGSSEAERAIVYLYQLDKMDDLCGEINKLVERKQEMANSQVTERGVKLSKTKADKRKDHHEALKKQLEDSKKELEAKREKKKRLEERYQNIISEDAQMREEQDRLNRQKKEIKGQKKETTERIMSYVRKPYNLQIEMDMRLQGLWQNMHTLRLPRNVANEFFKEVIEHKVCICGRCIGEQEEKIILRNASSYLGGDELAVLNGIKSALKEYEVDRELKQERERLKRLQEREQEVNNGLDRLANTMAEKGNQEILKVKNTIRELEIDMNRLEAECHKLSTTDYLSNPELTEENNIKKAYEAWKLADEYYTKMNGTYEFIQKAEKLKKYVQNIKKKTLQKLKKYIVQETNGKVQEIIQNDNIRIKDINGHLLFEDRDNLSEGQNLAVAYAYIGILFAHSQDEFPFIVDSPAASLDLNMRREIAKIMPDLFHQMIVFVTSGEREGFADTYFEREGVQYYTVAGDRNKAVELHEGKDYFAKFQERSEQHDGF